MEWIIAAVIILSIVLFNVIYYLLDRKTDFFKDDFFKETENMTLQELLESMDEEDESTKIKSARSAVPDQQEESEADTYAAGEEAGTSQEEDTMQEAAEEFDETTPFVWDVGKQGTAGETKGEPILEYRIIIDQEVEHGMIDTVKKEYFVGKSRDCDIILKTKDKTVGKRYLKIRPLPDKQLFVAEPGKEGWTIAVWSEEKEEWEPRQGEILFGMEDQIIVALTQFHSLSEKNISRFELAMPGYLTEEESKEEDLIFSPMSQEDDDIFDI